VGFSTNFVFIFPLDNIFSLTIFKILLMGTNLLPANILADYEVHEWKHACAILKSDYPSEWQDIIDVLNQFKLCKSWITIGGGRKSKVSENIDGFLYKKGWIEKKFATSIHVDSAVYNSPTHKVDCYKNGIGVEIEWNNKDPFYDRDLNNFRLLFELRVINVGVIITRCDHLQAIFTELGRGASYGESTTHMSKLLPKIEGGGGGGCPILVFGISNKLYDQNC
jgi:hypothetical protein